MKSPSADRQLSLVDRLGIDPETQARYIQDLHAYGHHYMQYGGGRPDFSGGKRLVDKDDTAAADYWIARYPDMLRNKESNLVVTSAYFDYLSDLSRDENRAGGFNGLLGPDPDIQMLRRSLLQKMRTFAPPSIGAPELFYSPHAAQPAFAKYMNLFDKLFIRTVGIAEADALRSVQSSTASINPPFFTEQPLDTQWQLMQKRMLREVRTLAF